jgi:hypothetical protein
MIMDKVHVCILHASDVYLIFVRCVYVAKKDTLSTSESILASPHMMCRSFLFIKFGSSDEFTPFSHFYSHKDLVI